MSPRNRLILAVAAGAVALAAVSAVIAATIASDDGGPERSAVQRAETPTPAAFDSVLEDLPAGLRQRVQALPDRLRDQVLRAFEEGRLALSGVEEILRQFETRTTSVRVGSVVEAGDSELILEVYTTGERAKVAIDGKTVLRRGTDTIRGSGLKRDELVMVLSMDGGRTAFSVTAFGVSPP
jgi:hypothetical protein